MVRPSVPDPPQISDYLWHGFRGKVAWDIGSNCGQAIMEMVWNFEKVIGFEPSPDSCEYAQKHLRLWCPNYDVSVHRVAVSDHDGELELAYPATEQKETGQLVTIGTKGMEWEPEDWGEVERVTVPCRTADSLVGEFGWPDFIKVDTEGHEFKVLYGANDILARGRTDFLVEFHTPENHFLCEQMLLGAGYTVGLVRHPNYMEGTAMWHQHGWLRAFAPSRP